jgi:hypothetical protein
LQVKTYAPAEGGRRQDGGGRGYGGGGGCRHKEQLGIPVEEGFFAWSKGNPELFKTY